MVEADSREVSGINFERLYEYRFRDVDQVAVHPKFLPYSFRGALPPSSRLTRVYLGTPVLWRVLGKQFLVIGRKGEA